MVRHRDGSWRRSAGLPGPEPRARRATVTRGWCRNAARTSEQEHDAVEVNPPDYCLDRPGTPMRREEIEAPFGAFPERLNEAHLGAAWTQVDQGESQPAVARFKDDRPGAELARIPPQLGRLPVGRSSGGLSGTHSGRACRRHRASDKSAALQQLSNRAILALSTGLPNIGFTMLDQSPGLPRSCTARHAAQGAGAAGGVPEVISGRAAGLKAIGDRAQRREGE